MCKKFDCLLHDIQDALHLFPSSFNLKSINHKILHKKYIKNCSVSSQPNYLQLYHIECNTNDKKYTIIKYQMLEC